MSYAQGRWAFASGCDGTESSQEGLDPEYRVWPLSLCHFAGPGVSDAPEEKRGQMKVPTGQDVKLESPIDISRVQ